MNQKQKPVLIVAIVLVGLILLPVLLLLVSKIGSGSRDDLVNGGNATSSSGSGFVADYELQQLADRAEQLLSDDLAKAVQSGDLELGVIGSLREKLAKAQSDLSSGRLSRAKSRFEGFIAAAESRLEAVAIVNRARELKNAAYFELQRLGGLRPAFENTFAEAVSTYDLASEKLELGDFKESVEGFELVEAILGDIEVRAIQQVATLLEKAGAALSSFDLGAAESAYRSVLEIAPDHQDAIRGLEMTVALDGIVSEISSILELEKEGEIDQALVALDALAETNPDNRFIEKLREEMLGRRLEQNFAELIGASLGLEASGDFAGAIAAVEEALSLKDDQEQQGRLAGLKTKAKAVRLEELLAGGFVALQNGRYESARDVYKEAVALAPESSEARTGLEKASSLFLASVRYTQNIRGVERRIKEGRYPLAAKLFNEALLSRPAKLSSEALEKEDLIRSALEVQSQQVVVNMTSDKRTHVSIIGVLPPERFKTMDLKLFPDVYKVRGTCGGYRSVERELRVDALKSGQRIHIQCTERL